MRAYVIEKPGLCVLKEVVTPEIGPDEVLMKTRTSGICHSDYDLMQGEYILPLHFPIIAGHEFCAEVIAMGKNVRNLRIGDRVVGECNIGCGVCPICQEIAGFCPEANHFGFTQDGSHQEYFKANGDWLHVVPDEIDDKTGAMIETFSIAFKGFHAAGGVDGSDFCVIYGGGSVGACAVAVSRALGAFTIVVEPVAFKRELCRRLGADAVIDPTSQDVMAEIGKYTGGLGADLVVECSGNAAAMSQTLDAVKNGGRVVFIGINFRKDIPVELGKFQAKGIRAMGSNGSPGVWERCIRFIVQMKIDLSPINTHCFPFAEVEKAYAFARNPDNQAVKVILTF